MGGCRPGAVIARRASAAVLALVAALASLPVAEASARTKWLCRPGLASNPCLAPLAVTEVTAAGPGVVVLPHGELVGRRANARRGPRPKVDCFYVYPTVSTQPPPNADLTIDRQLTDVAVRQASRFSRVCRMYAPVYRQLTVAGLFQPGFWRSGTETAYRDVARAWGEYLRRFNRGRGVVLIGHSQGTGLLRRLIRERIDRRRGVRGRLVSALLTGGNAKAQARRGRAGEFEHVLACRSARQTGCVVAYSSFGEAPPEGTFFGRPGSPFDAIFGGPTGAGLGVTCVNPAAPAGGAGALRPYFRTSSLPPGSVRGVRTQWVTFPALYRARCRNANGLDWLQVDDIGRAGDERPRVSAALGPAWGFHLADVSLALGNLVTLVERQASAYLRR